MVGEKAWLSWAREWRWWRRTSLCERVGHCATTPLVFLPLPGDVRVAVHTPLITLFGEKGSFIRNAKHAKGT
jgi:hypothetical protein